MELQVSEEKMKELLDLTKSVIQTLIPSAMKVTFESEGRSVELDMILTEVQASQSGYLPFEYKVALNMIQIKE